MSYLESLLFPYPKQTLRKLINSSNSSNIANKYYVFISNFMWIIVELSAFHYQNAGAFLSISIFRSELAKLRYFVFTRTFWDFGIAERGKHPDCCGKDV